MNDRTKARLLLAAALGLMLAVAVTALAEANTTIDSGTNQVRAAHNLAPLTTSAALTELAARRANELAAQGFLQHRSLSREIGGCWELYGENIGYHTTGYYTDADFVSAWAASPDHYANMIGNFTHQGSATVEAADGRTYAVQLFLRGCTVTNPPPAPRQSAPPPVVKPPTPGTPARPVVTQLPNTSVSMP